MKSPAVLRNTALGLLAALSLTAMAAPPEAGEGCDPQGRHGGAMYGMAGAEGHHGGRMGHGPMGGHMGGHMGGLSPRMLQSLQLSEAQRAQVTELTQAQAKTMQEQMSQGTRLGSVEAGRA